jgi:hypothetical protein
MVLPEATVLVAAAEMLEVALTDSPLLALLVQPAVTTRDARASMILFRMFQTSGGAWVGPRAAPAI